MRRPRWSVNRIVPAILLALLVLGCQTATTQRMYFAAVNVDEDNPTVKFYRISINAKARNLTADYRAGFYNATAVRELYGEVPPPGTSQPPDATTNAGQFMVAYDPATKQWQSINDSLFTIFYGANSKAMGEAVSIFAKNQKSGEQFGKLLASAVGGDAYQDSLDAEAQIAQEKANSAAISELLKESAKKIESATGKQAVDQEKLKFAKILGTYLGIPSGEIPTKADDLPPFFAKILKQLQKTNNTSEE